MDRTISCEICGEVVSWKDFQRHLVENHQMLFVQYIGLVAKSFDMLKWLNKKDESK